MDVTPSFASKVFSMLSKVGGSTGGWRCRRLVLSGVGGSHSGKRICSERALNVFGTGKNVLEKTFSPRTFFVPQERS